jgi:acyl carrier protein
MPVIEEKVLCQLQRVFQEVLEKDTLQITPETEQIDIPEWDSIAQVTMIWSIEKEFGIRFSAREASGLISVEAIVEAILAKTARP